MQNSEIISLFKEHNFRATPQRIAVYKYLYENRTHPDVDEIYNAVIRENPSFSKTTVYNSLEALAQEGIIIPVRIDSERIHYDANAAFHGHFICEECKHIFDFDITEFKSEGIDNFDIKQKDVYVSGLCPECKSKKSTQII